MIVHCSIDINDCSGLLTLEDESVIISYDVTLSNYKVTVYSKDKKEIVSQEIVEYDPTQSIWPIVDWLIKGLHGIPHEYRLQK